jgi:hypothetical protein
MVLALADSLEISATRRVIAIARSAVGAARTATAADFVIALPEFVFGELDAELKRVSLR